MASTLLVARSQTECNAGLIVHSDQGGHCKMQLRGAMLAQRGVKQSMSREGNCLDNDIVESFVGALKAEYFYLAALKGID